MFGSTTKKILFGVVVAVLLLGSFFAGRIQNKAIAVQAQDEPGDQARAEVSFDCNINQVAIYGNRAHIRCGNAPTGDPTVHYFAIENNSENELMINRVMAIGLTNMSMDRWVRLWYDTSETNNPTGCQDVDCRKLIAVIGHK